MADSKSNVGRWTLDLTATALNSLLCYWGEKFDQLDVYCDESKPLQSYFGARDNLFALMVGRTDKQYFEFDRYKRPVTFDSARPISFASSINTSGLQIAEVIAASVSYVLKNRIDETVKEWRATLLPTVHQESIFPDLSDADARTDRGTLNMLVFAELVRRSRKGIDLLDGIEDFLRSLTLFRNPSAGRSGISAVARFLVLPVFPQMDSILAPAQRCRQKLCTTNQFI